METLKYKVIKSKSQYANYCRSLEELVTSNSKAADEIELLTLLIEKWDQDHNGFEKGDPITLLKHLMQERKISSLELAGILNVSKGLVSDIMNYKKGLSKEVIRGLSSYFKVSHEAFNRRYELQIPTNVKQPVLQE